MAKKKTTKRSGAGGSNGVGGSKGMGGSKAAGGSSRVAGKAVAKSSGRGGATKTTGRESSSGGGRETQAVRASAKRRTTPPPSPRGAAKVGSHPKSARQFGGKGDFGVPETGSERDRAYTSRNTKASDPGAAQPHANDRVSGAGGNASGVGSSSGGDVDTDLVGLDGGVVSQSGPDDRTDGPDMITGDMITGNARPSDAFASKRKSDGSDGKRDANARARGARRERLDNRATVDRSGGDVSTTDPGQASGAVTNPNARGDDSFAGEINMSEAGGIDNTRADGEG